MFIYTSTLHHYVTLHYKHNTVHGNVLLWLYLYKGTNWEIETDNKETGQIIEKKWEYNEAGYQLFIDIRKACNSVRRAVLYNILIEFGIHRNLKS